MSDQPTLKPCPFCGGKAIIREYRQHSNIAAYPWAAKASCEECHQSAVGVTGQAAGDKAAEAWNLRAHVDITDEMVDRAQSSLGDSYFSDDGIRAALAAALNQ